MSGEQLEAACGEPAKQPRHPAQTGTVREPRAPPHPTRKRSKRSNGAPRNGKIFARCIPKRLFAGLFGCMARISCQNQLISDAWRANLARKGRFPVRGHFRDAWSTKLATDCRPETHRGGILPRIDTRERTAQVYCHCQSGQERIRAQSRHRRTLGNASRHNLAMAGSPKMHRGYILPRQPPSRMLLDDILPRRPSTARACCEIAVVPRSRKTPPERSVGQFNNARQHVQETMKIFWYLSLRNGTKNALA